MALITGSFYGVFLQENTVISVDTSTLTLAEAPVLFLDGDRVERVLPGTLAQASRQQWEEKEQSGRPRLHVSQQLFLPKCFSSTTYHRHRQHPSNCTDLDNASVHVPTATKDACHEQRPAGGRQDS